MRVQAGSHLKLNDKLLFRLPIYHYTKILIRDSSGTVFRPTRYIENYIHVLRIIKKCRTLVYRYRFNYKGSRVSLLIEKKYVVYRFNYKGSRVSLLIEKKYGYRDPGINFHG